MSNLWHCSIPHTQTEDASVLPGALPSQNISLRLFIIWTPNLVLQPSQQGTETSFCQVKNPCFGFFVVQKYPSVSFSRMSIIRKAAFLQTKTLGIAKCKRVSRCLAQTQPEQASGEERAFPSPDVSNKGQSKTQPWWDPALPLSSGNVNHRARLLQWECRCSCHINQTRLRDQKLQQNQMAAYGADNASVHCACSPSASLPGGEMGERPFLPAASPCSCCLWGRESCHGGKKCTRQLMR